MNSRFEMRPSRLAKPFRAMALTAAIALPAAALSAQANMPQSGRIDTLPIGQYECALPGDASGPAWEPVPQRDFTILNGSSYEAKGERGIYLLRGSEVTFTAGPLKGRMMERTGQRMLREKAADGTLGRIRCVLAGPVN